MRINSKLNSIPAQHGLSSVARTCLNRLGVKVAAVISSNAYDIWDV